MKRSGGNPDRHRAFTAGLTLASALLIAIFVVGFDPLPAPAAETTPSTWVDSAATPVVADLLPSAVSDAGCPDGTDSVDALVDDETAPGATPVATADEDLPAVDESCETIDGGVVVPDFGAEKPESEAHPGTAPIAEAYGVSPIAHASSGKPVIDPFLDGFPAVPSVEDANADPFITGLPATELAMTGAASDEATLSGQDDSEAPAIDPTLMGLPAIVTPADPMLSGAEVTSEIAIQVDVVTVDGDIIPGGSISYLFRIMNPGLLAATFRLVATADLPGWSAVVTEPDSGEIMAEPVYLGSGAAIDVVVVVTAPQEASIGDQVSTSLTAVMLH